MKKDAYWFKHDSNAKDDPKCLVLIEELGLEGYGIFWILIETLRDQKDYKAPLRILPALARRYGTTLEKMKAVIQRYDLFKVTEDEFFFSESLMERMESMTHRKQQAKISGIKGNLIKYGYAKKEELKNLSDREIIALNNQKQGLNDSDRGAIDTLSNPSRIKIREDKIREDKSIKTNTDNSGGKSSSSQKTESSDSSALKETVQSLIDCWNSANDTRLRYTGKKRTQVKQRLKTFSKDELAKAIRIRGNDKWIHENNQQSNWDALFRNDEQVDQWLNRGQKKTPPSKGGRGDGLNGTAQTREALTETEAKKLCDKKRLDFKESLFTITQQNGEPRYIPNFN